MIRPISVATNGLISNSLKTKSTYSDGFLSSLVVPVSVTPNLIYSVDHNLRKKVKIKEQIEREEKEIVEIIKFIAERIL